MSTAKPQVLLEHYLQQLKLPTILQEYEEMAVVCRRERADYQTFLLRLVEQEAIDRARRPGFWAGYVSL